MSINVTQLARRLRVPTKELLAKLPELGFSLGKRAIKVNDREAAAIQRAWADMKRKEIVQKKHREQQEREDRKKARLEATKDNAIVLPSVMSVREFAETLDLPVTNIIKELMRAGILAGVNERLDFDTAAIVAGDLGFNVTNVDKMEGSKVDEDLDRIKDALSKGDASGRAPVVVVMGHVDHGKTRLLDAIRKTNVIVTEAGGITQHIGAYQVDWNGQAITFIDTPGHEAFTVMRSRGAKVADIAILVVAADDGVQPQTREAIEIIKAAELPMIVAINKIDKNGADIEKTKRELADLNLLPEDWGGNTIMVPISAKNEEGIDNILDALLLVFEVEKENIVADPKMAAIGTIIESHIDSGAGPVATVLIQGGTLHSSDTLGVGGANYGRVRAMRNWSGEIIDNAGPSVPVQILGWKVAPVVGDVLEVVPASELTKKAKSKMKSSSMKFVGGIKRLDSSDSDDEKKMLNIIMKADVLGSIEAILGLFDKVNHESVDIAVVSKALGNVTESDVIRAYETGAIIVAFHVKVPASVEQLARDKGVDILSYDIIYKMFEDVVARLQELLSDEIVISELGKMEILAIFQKKDNGYVVGGKIISGIFEEDSKLRIWRGEELIGEGHIKEMRAGKEVVRELHEGEEGGIYCVGKVKIEVGDVFEAYKEKSVARKLIVEGANA